MCVFGGMRKRLFINDPNSKDYRVALCRCALNPDYSLNLRRNSLDRHLTGISLFIWRGRDLSPDGAALTARNFRETMRLLARNQGSSLQSSDEQDRSGGPMQTQICTRRHGWELSMIPARPLVRRCEL